MKNYKRIIILLLLCLLLFSWGCRSSSQAQPTNCTELNNLCASKKGAPYVWGAEGPDKFDCSGFIYWIFRKRNDPIPRTTARKYWIYFDSKATSWRNATCGSLVWWTFEKSRLKGHIGIMVTNPKFWQAGSSGGVYSRKFFDGSFWDKNFVGAKKGL